VPWVVVEFLAGQLGIADASVVKSYGSRLPTRHEHAREIAGVVGYRDFSAAEVELRAWLEARLWATPERPGVSFDRATAWLVERRVLLPGATVLVRLVPSAREATTDAGVELHRRWQADRQACRGGGTCNGDSGGPNFLGAGADETRIIAGLTSSGDTYCKATSVTYRLDTPAVRQFLAQYVPLP